MSKKSEKSTQLNRNPLSIALGAYLNHETYKMTTVKTAGAVAKELKLGESLYRQILSGNARIHPKYIFRFISVFAASDIQLDPFCKLLIAIQSLDAQMATLTEYDDAIENLQACGDTQLEALIQGLKPLIVAVRNEPEKIKEKSLLEPVLRNIGKFLTDSETYGMSPNEMQKANVTKVFNQLPSIYYTFIGNIIDDLLNLPTGFRRDDLWRWERANHHRIEYLYAVAYDETAIIDVKNFERYGYEYLWLDSFLEGHMVFLSEAGSTELNKSFAKELRKTFKPDDDRLKNFDSGMSKFRCYSSSDHQSVEAILGRPNSNDSYKAAWIFVLKDNIEVGIKSKYAGRNFTEFVSLNFEECQTLLSQIKYLIGQSSDGL